MTKLTALLVFLTAFTVFSIPNSVALEVETDPLHEGLVDESVVLKCSYDEPAKFADQYIYTWSYITEGSDKITIFINNGGEEQSFGEYAGRVSTAGDYASLQIDNLVISDTGNYECDVDFYVSGDQGVATTRLQVYQIVESVDILDIERGDYEFVQSGEMYTAICEAENGFPPARLEWYKDDELMSNGSESILDNMDGTYNTRSEVSFITLFEHDGAVVKCQSNQEPAIMDAYIDDYFILSVSGAGITSFSVVILLVSLLFSSL
ncbi:V-set and immunoglobulin domain-containing protein 1-like isoform X2 [Saccoglossus kowalevskii]|uniref:Poliovirus receptor homolog n=1 Tax=Saccoglossus kowalevskii TaxID=10224 RepID=A0ABM0MWF6_SACKO|nr:PREDICTED: poliovirus receptor homolog [Saccoglossus kowalevskii]